MAREGITAIRRGLDETKRAMHAVLSALKSVQDWDIVTAELRVCADKNFRVSLPELRGCKATNSITIKTTDLTRVGDIVAVMVNPGMNGLDDVTYGLQKSEPLRTMALDAAVADARHIAQSIANGLGVTLDKILNVTATRTTGPPVSLGHAAASYFSNRGCDHSCRSSVAAAPVRSRPPPMCRSPIHQRPLAAAVPGRTA
jgi:uncharacterized protein YggE